MESSNTFAPYQQDKFLSGAPRMTTHMTSGIGYRASRRPSLRTNFSYPKLSRHESNESRSSSGSVPGMTDASDSDFSFDEDGIYNTSAGELWDSFWPDNVESSSIYRQSQESYLPLLQPSQSRDCLKVNPIRHQPYDADDETIKIATREYDPRADEPPSPRTTIQSPPLQSTLLLSTPSRPTPKRSPVTYSVYPKPPVVSVPRHPHPPHPPRTSSLSFEPPSPPPRPSFLRGSRSSAGLKFSKSTHNMNSLFIAPSVIPYNNKVASPQQRSSTAANTAASVPVSPAYPPPPTPKTLRPSTSAFNLRDKARVRNANSGFVSHHGVTAPLLPSPLPAPLPTRPQFVSVFELDSDSESETDADEEPSFARRIARGLHKRRTIEKKRGVAGRKARRAAAGLNAATLDASSSGKDREERLRDGGSLSRKRGSSLGRIFGFIGR
ncbi:hypothetical protein F4823DRAFT_480432 [Ustulina deusta]|nr:hypothetical protein F4823DRAFT_480432 [Ustulina deusta]